LRKYYPSASGNNARRVFLQAIGEELLKVLQVNENLIQQFEPTYKFKGWLEWEELVKHFDDRCIYCNEEPTSGNPLTEEHLIQIQDGGLHYPGNVVPACRRCNLKRPKNKDNKGYFWEDYLKSKAENYEEQYSKIKKHIEDYSYDRVLDYLNNNYSDFMSNYQSFANVVESKVQKEITESVKAWFK
jgi:hypothetical protein